MPAPHKEFSSYLVSGGTAFVKPTDVYIANSAISPKWSEDSKALLVETTSANERTIRARRRSLQQGDPLPFFENSLLRYTVENGLREILYRAAEGELIGEHIFVGSGADALFWVMRVDSSSKLVYLLYFAPEGGNPRPLGSPLDSRISPVFISSPQSSRALVAVTTQDKQLQIFLVTPNETRLLTVPGKWQFAQFTSNTKDGTARVAVGQVDEKQKGTGSIFDINYQTGKVSEVTRENALFELPKRTPPLFREEIYRVTRAGRQQTGTPNVPPVPLSDDSLPALKDLDLLEDNPNPRRLAMARGIAITAERSPDGLKVAYQTAQGFFVAELIPLSPEQTRAKLKRVDSP